MHLKAGSRTFALDRRRHGMPPALAAALAAAVPNRDVLARCGHRRSRPGSALAAPGDLPAILRIAAALSDTAPEAETRGFLRARFRPRQYLRLIEDGCIRTARVQGEVVGFATVIPWRHPLIAAERAAIQWGPQALHLGFVQWSHEDCTPIARAGKLMYIAEVAAAPQHPRAAHRLLPLLLNLYGEYPDCSFFSVCSELPRVNVRPALLYHRLGLRRVGCVRLPFRFVRCGPYPGRWSVVAPFQSGIWLKSPLRPAAPHP